MPATNPGTTNLVSWWSLDEASGTRADSHGSNNLTDNNTVGSTTGIQSNAANFVSANSEYLSGSAPISAYPFSIAFWGQWASGLVNTVPVGSGSTASNNPLIMFQRCDLTGNLAGNRIKFFVRNVVAGSMQIISSGNVDDSSWHHFVGVSRASNDHEFYVDGSSVGTSTTTVDLSSTTFNTWGIGALIRASVGLYTNGAVDEVSVWNTDLTTDEIAFLYNSGAGATYSDVAGGGAVPIIMQQHHAMGWR